MKLEWKNDGHPDEFALYQYGPGMYVRRCGIYIHPRDEYTRLIWNYRADADLPEKIDVTDVPTVRMLVMALAQSTGEEL